VCRKGDCPEGVDVDLSEYLNENELDLARNPSCSYLSDYSCILYFEKVHQLRPSPYSKFQASRITSNSDAILAYSIQMFPSPFLLPLLLSLFLYFLLFTHTHRYPARIIYQDKSNRRLSGTYFH